MTSVRVVVRARPPNSREKASGAGEICLQMTKTQTSITNPDSKAPVSEKSKSFTFDRCFWSVDASHEDFASQEVVFNEIGKDILDNAFQGYNTSLMAYGQTSAGKTFSMMGSADQPGLVPRLCEGLFARMEADAALTRDANGQAKLIHNVEVSYMEIYQEQVKDLLAGKKDSKGEHSLKVREHPVTGPYVEGLKTVPVACHSDISMLIEQGNVIRTTASTKMNDVSSRSHAIFTIKFDQIKYGDGADGLEGASEKSSKINLVDLAGSERQKHTQATGERLKEGAAINQSLTTLGRVISSLAERGDPSKQGGDKKAGFVSYRDSSLTWLLRDSLGGNSKTIMLAAVSPVADCFEETLSTLRYAARAKKIVNNAIVNEDANLRLIRELRAEIDALRNSITSPARQIEGSTVDPAQDAELVRLREQLAKNESLVQTLRTSWEDKFRTTQAVIEARKLAFSESGVGLRVATEKPHLLSLNESLYETGVMLFYIEIGETVIGSDEHSDIQLDEEDVVPQHCRLVCTEIDDVWNVTFERVEGPCVVNEQNLSVGQIVSLHQGDRVLLGEHALFRYNDPREAAILRKQNIGRRQSRADGILTPQKRMHSETQLELPPASHMSTVGEEMTSSTSLPDVSVTPRAIDRIDLSKLNLDPTAPIIITEDSAQEIEDMVELVKNGTMDDESKDLMVRRIVALRLALQNKEAEESGLQNAVVELKHREKQLHVEKTQTEIELEKAKKTIRELKQYTQTVSAVPMHTRVSIPRAIQMNDVNGTFHAYEIAVNSGEDSWTLYRRFKDFDLLNKQIRARFHTFRCELPSKLHIFNKGDKVVEERRQRLELYLRYAVSAYITEPLAPVSRFPCRRTLCETMPFLDPEVTTYSHFDMSSVGQSTPDRKTSQNPKESPVTQHASMYEAYGDTSHQSPWESDIPPTRTSEERERPSPLRHPSRAVSSIAATAPSTSLSPSRNLGATQRPASTTASFPAPAVMSTPPTKNGSAAASGGRPMSNIVASPTAQAPTPVSSVSTASPASTNRPIQQPTQQQRPASTSATSLFNSPLSSPTDSRATAPGRTASPRPASALASSPLSQPPVVNSSRNPLTTSIASQSSSPSQTPKKQSKNPLFD